MLAPPDLLHVCLSLDLEELQHAPRFVAAVESRLLLHSPSCLRLCRSCPRPCKSSSCPFGYEKARSSSVMKSHLNSMRTCRTNQALDIIEYTSLRHVNNCLSAVKPLMTCVLCFKCFLCVLCSKCSKCWHFQHYGTERHSGHQFRFNVLKERSFVAIPPPPHTHTHVYTSGDKHLRYFQHQRFHWPFCPAQICAVKQKFVQYQSTLHSHHINRS